MFMGLEVQGVSRSFDGVLAVDNVSLSIPQGEFWCFLGPSGCGKTTLLRMIAGLDHPGQGRFMIDGRDVTREPAHSRNFGMVFQSLALFPHLSVEDNVGYPLKLRGKDRYVRRERVRELLELIRLPEAGARRVEQLSGGQRQRVAIARALAQEPRLFLMDEPLSALDAKLRDHMQVELRQLQRDLKITTIVVTHDQREAMTMADKVVVMEAGRVQQVGPPVEIYRKPANRFVAGFLGQSNLLDAEVAGPGAVRFCGAVLPISHLPEQLRAGERITLCVRPENVTIATHDSGLVADVTFVRDVGSGVELQLDCAGSEILAALTPAQWAALPSQDRVSFGFQSEHLNVLTR